MGCLKSFSNDFLYEYCITQLIDCKISMNAWESLFSFICYDTYFSGIIRKWFQLMIEQKKRDSSVANIRTYKLVQSEDLFEK